MLDPQTAAQLVLGFYLLAAAAVLWRQAARCEHGYRVWLLYAVERLYVGLMFHWRANRRCPFPDDGPALIIANHRSPVDPMFVWMNHHLAGRRGRIRAINFLMAREYYEVRGMRWMFRALRSIPLDREAREMRPVREALRRLERGELVGIFPEGGINREKDLRKAGPGVAFLALKARVPVYPVFIHNSPGGESMVEPFCRPARVRVTYGEPIDLSAYYGRRNSGALLVKVTDLLMRRLAALGGVDYRGVDEDEDDRTAPAAVVPAERATG